MRLHLLFFQLKSGLQKSTQVGSDLNSIIVLNGEKGQPRAQVYRILWEGVKGQPGAQLYRILWEGVKGQPGAQLCRILWEGVKT